MGKLTRRAFMLSGAVLGGGALFGFIASPNRLSLHPFANDEDAWLATWVRINKDNSITVFVPHAEMGQGAHTALPMMLAEEMEADWSLVNMEQAPAESVFAVGDMIKGFVADDLEPPAILQRHVDYAFYKIAGLMNMQITGGSASVRFTGQAGMRRAGAAAKEMLIRAAAENWQVAESECEAGLSYVHHSGSGKSSSFADLAAKAAQYETPLHPQLKRKEDYTICGQPLPRFDTAAKVIGDLNYGIDIKLPDMKYAAVRHAPVFGGKAVSFDESAVKARRGVEQVIMLNDAIVLIADSYWRAKSALDTLAVEFSSGEHGEFDSRNLFDKFDSLLTSEKPEIDFTTGDTGKILATSKELITADYKVPFLAHATMEPMNCTAWFHNGQLEVWTGTQDLLATRAFAAEIANLETEQVLVYPVQLGGGFGRRLPTTGNYIEDAVSVAMQVNYPVKLIYSREEDIQHDYYRPAAQSRFQGGLGVDAFPAVWKNTYTDIGINDDTAAAIHPYAIANQEIGRVVHETPVPVSYWRSVEHSAQGFFTESFIDELAHKAGKDPLQYRLSLLEKAPRFYKVLETAAEKIGWGKTLPENHGLGIAIVESFGTIVAQALEVSVTENDELKLHSMSAAVDSDEVINPDTAQAQVEGGIIFGLTAALYGKISLEKGRVLQSNFPDYDMLRLGATPSIDVTFIESGERIGGMGEVGVPPAAAALCNAIFAANGQRYRELPLIGQGLRLSV
ncbi:MAG: molybdopterin-dependent oxidoreductase [Gammaproteobacteria bacterium]|nr:molybdopterin-dependent oxidoreductase [Gammaproteobacteria bacterium]